MVCPDCPLNSGQSANVPIHQDKTQRGNQAPAREHLKGGRMLIRHMDTGNREDGLLPRLPKKN